MQSVLLENSEYIGLHAACKVSYQDTHYMHAHTCTHRHILFCSAWFSKCCSIYCGNLATPYSSSKMLSGNGYNSAITIFIRTHAHKHTHVDIHARTHTHVRTYIRNMRLVTTTSHPLTGAERVCLHYRMVI